MMRKHPTAILATVLALVAFSVGAASPASATPLTTASDSFTRSVTGGLGSADVGGAWTLAGGASRFAVASGAAQLTTNASTQVSGYLLATAIQDTDVSATLGMSALPVGGSVYLGLLARHSASTDYNGRVIVGANGSVAVGLMAGTTSLKTATVAGLTASAGAGLRLRFQAIGVNPTTVRARAWAVGSPEPASWQVSATDSTAGPQTAGSVGIRAYLSSSVTNAPIVQTVDDLAATSLAPANASPTASFAATPTGLAVAFDGSASSDSDGTIASYAWTFGDGTTDTGATPTHTYAAGGTYTVGLTVTDNGGATGSTSKSVAVAAANRAPIASFTANPNGLAVAFDGSGSNDPDGTIASYAWTFGDGTTDTGATPTHTYAAGGTYTVGLTVTDNGGATGSTSKPVSVAAANRAPTASFTATPTGLAVAYDGSASSDPDGTIASYAWTFGDGTTDTGATPTHTYAAGGTYTVGLTVTDNGGATGSTSKSFSVAAANRPPTASFTATPTGLAASVDASASTDPDGTIASYGWTYGDGAIGTGKTDSHTYATAGTYTVTLTVTDDGGATDTTTRSVTVAAANKPPVASFTASATALTANVDASASTDPDGTIASYAWDFGDGTTGTGKATSHAYAAGGSYTVTLTVTDDAGATGTAQKQVSVAPVNRSPMPTILEQSNALYATVWGNQSFDPDGTITSYAWKFGDGKTGTGATLSHGYAAAGSYTVTLTVTDNGGATATLTRAISVYASGVHPTQAQWFADTTSAIGGGTAYLDAHALVSKPAIVLDIDNTSLQSYYQPFAATPAVLAFEQRAIADGYTILFATGRTKDGGGTLNQLKAGGYRVDSLCFKDPAAPSTQASKTACRAAWVAQGYTIVANVGNHVTDLDGGNSGQEYLLPNYNFLD